MHKRARTNPQIRKEIQLSTLSERVLAQLYDISRATVRKWKNRQTVEDNSHRPHTLQSTLWDKEERIVGEIRRTLLLPLDDLLIIVRAFIEPSMSRSALDRCLRRQGVSDLTTLIPVEEQPIGSRKPFNAYPPGHLQVRHIPIALQDTDRLPMVLFVAIDRCSRWLYVELQPSDAVDIFFAHLVQFMPFSLSTVYLEYHPIFFQEPTDKSKVFAFPGMVQERGIALRWVHSPMEDSADSPTTTTCSTSLSIPDTEIFLSQLQEWVSLYNQSISLKILGHRTPLQVLDQWRSTTPELFPDDGL